MVVKQKYIVVITTRAITGGTEAAHQLVYALNSLNIQASICYFPFGPNYNVPVHFSRYVDRCVNFEDRSETLFVFPEIMTRQALKIKRGTVAIWWLSVDNYYGVKHENFFTDLYLKSFVFLKNRIPIFLMKNYLHFVQSEYAKSHLMKQGIRPYYLTDYISGEKFEKNKKWNIATKKNIVFYNPKKGKIFTENIIKSLPSVFFMPIVDLEPNEVRALLQSGKVYIDFGHHPGKDRIPREAVQNDCVIITSRTGSAAFIEDLPIPDIYKIEIRDPNFMQKFAELLEGVFNNFEFHHSNFLYMRQQIQFESTRFMNEVSMLFDSSNPPSFHN